MNLKGMSAVHRTLKRIAHRLDVTAENQAFYFRCYRDFSEFITHAVKSVCCLKFFNPLSPFQEICYDAD